MNFKVNEMKKWLLFFIVFSNPITANALEIQLELCVANARHITDIEFISNAQALITVKEGELFWYKGCDVPMQEIASLRVESNSELGLLGIAVPADFSDSKTAFIYYSPKTKGRKFTRLSAFTLNLQAKNISLENERVLLELKQPFGNHDGGALKFGPDGSLYLGLGDGGRAGDPYLNGQNITTLLGTVLRIKPDLTTAKGYTIPKGNLQDFMPEALPEILAYGLRNPWKFSFSSKGDFIIADVGQNKLEEVNIISAKNIGTRILNMGWNIKEAKSCFKSKLNCAVKGLVDPAFEYTRAEFGYSITGGETLMANDKEYYLFGDYVTGKMGALDLTSPSVVVAKKEFPGKNWVTFGKNPAGEVYVASFSGGIYRVILK